MKRQNVRMSLFLTFLKIGAFTFGGGYAMIPLIQREVVERKSWISQEDILDIVAIAESTPGPIAINSATFVGYRAGRQRRTLKPGWPVPDDFKSVADMRRLKEQTAGRKNLW